MSSITPTPGANQNVLQPLQREEIDFLNRLLQDPTLFPRDFKRWVTDHASDTVDIAKSQVHGLVDSAGDVIIPPPPLISQIVFKPFNTLITIPGGSGATIITASNVKCDGNPVIFEFQAPFCQYAQLRFRIQVDASNQGWVGEYKTVSGVADAAPDVNKINRSPVYIQRQFTPTKGEHEFKLDCQALTSVLQYVGGGGTFFGEGYADGFLRISRA